jgi:hypothetical protein
LRHHDGKHERRRGVMAAENPQSIKGSYAASHPATAERWSSIDAAHVEVVAKKSRGLPLVPERK